MFHSSNSTTNSKLSSSPPSSMVATDHKDTPNLSENSKKTSASEGQMEDQAKKILINHLHSAEREPIRVAVSFDTPKFVRAAEMAIHTRTNVQAMPEISDEELLEMAIKFEKEHPQ